MIKEIKQDMTEGIKSFELIFKYVKNDELRELVKDVQSNVKKQLRRGNYNRSI